MVGDAAVEEGTGDRALGGHLRYLEADVLELGQRSAEGLALLHVPGGDLQQVFGGGDGGHGDAHPLLREIGHQVEEGAVEFAEEVLLGDAYVLEEEFGGVLGLLADLVEVAASFEALGTAFDDEEGQAVRPALGGGLRDDDHEVGEDAVGDEGLGAVEQPVVAPVLGGGTDPLEVGVGAGLGHRDGGDGLAGAESGQPAALLFLGGERGQVRPDDVVVQADGEAGGPGAGELLGDHGRVAEVGVAAAPVLLGHGQAQQALAARGPPGLAADDAVLLPLLVVRQHLLVQEGAHGLAERLVVGVEDAALHRSFPLQPALDGFDQPSAARGRRA